MDILVGEPVQRANPVGLTSGEALSRLHAAGANALVNLTPRPVRRALDKLWAPVPWMLEAAILLQLALGDYAEAALVAFLLLFNGTLGFVQEGRAQATLDALKSQLALGAVVERDGRWISAPAETLVVGDLVKLSLGAIVAADVRLVGGSVLLDQSMLTGESLPIEAAAGAETYAGALVRRGEATAEVIATGARTKFGRTAELVQTAKGESSQQKAVLGVVRNLALFNGAITTLLTIYAWLLPMPRGDIVPLVLVAILSSIPVALPSMFTLAAAVGAQALARSGVLPTRLSAVDEARPLQAATRRISRGSAIRLRGASLTT
jgi:H+-transporting ATPase